MFVVLSVHNINSYVQFMGDVDLGPNNICHYIMINITFQVFYMNTLICTLYNENPFILLLLFMVDRNVIHCIGKP